MLFNVRSKGRALDAGDSLTHRLQNAVGCDNVFEQELLCRHTTFQIGGPAQWLVLPCKEPEIVAINALCRETSTPLHVLGLGSNVLAADEGVRGVVLKLAERFAGIALEEEGRITAQAGASNDAIAAAACDAGLTGFEFAADIPGTIGGAAIMNAGAYGGQLSDIAEWVRCLTPDGCVIKLSAEEACWGYRKSSMMEKGCIVLAVGLRLTPDDPANIRERMDGLRQRRKAKQPLDMPSAGSTFKRPEGHYAGQLIQDAGMQGHRVGGAQVSPKHAGFVVNCDDATAADVRQVIADVQHAVRARTGVTLEPEVHQWGF